MGVLFYGVSSSNTKIALAAGLKTKIFVTDNIAIVAGITGNLDCLPTLTKKEENGLYIFISDDGKGFDTENIDEKKHFGLRGMKNRADLIRAGLFITSEKDSGTQIKIISLKNTTYKMN